MIIGIAIFDGFIFRIRIEGVHGDERTQVTNLLQQSGVRPLTRKRSHDKEALSAHIIQSLNFIAHSVAFVRGNTLHFNLHRAHTPPEGSKNDIVSRHDAIVTELIVLSGFPMVKIGDTVRAGQVIVKAAMQVGTEVGEPDEYGRLTYTPILHPSMAFAIVRGIVSHSRMSILTPDMDKDETVLSLVNQILSEENLGDFDNYDIHTSQIGGGSFVLEVVLTATKNLIQ